MQLCGFRQKKGGAGLNTQYRATVSLRTRLQQTAPNNVPATANLQTRPDSHRGGEVRVWPARLHALVFIWKEIVDLMNVQDESETSVEHLALVFQREQ